MPNLNNPLAAKLKSRLGRSLVDFRVGPKGENDPRSYRATMQAGSAQIAGDGLAVDGDGKLSLDPGEGTLLDAAEAASEAELKSAGQAIALGTPGPFALEQNTTAFTISNTINETPIYSYVVPGGLLIGSRRLRLSLLGQMLNNSGAARNATVRVKLGGTTVYGDLMRPSGADIPVSANIRLVTLWLEFAALGSSVSQMLWGKITLGNTGATSVAGSGFMGSATPTAALDMLIGSSSPSSIDMAGQQTLEVTIEMSAASASYTWTRRVALLEVY